MSGIGWEEVKRRARERRTAAGLPVRTEAAKRAAMARLTAEVRAALRAGSTRDRVPAPED
ncbi:hypothetical protein [Streptomyces sp. NPDC048603]|uniref:hypothetical protein n=1 Tax=Streptomyces sp. NPDC048603 TaxID=3365577 RepID=UPI003720B092